jgi:uncharacterized protein
MENNYALITGAGKGIGRAIAAELAKRKFKLVLHSLEGEGLSEFGKELEKKYGIVTEIFEADLTEYDAPRRLHEFVIEKGIGISVLVNNAGIGFEGPVESYSETNVDKMILVNTRALTLITSFFTPDLKKAGEAYLLNVSSFGAYTPAAYKSIYLATKSYIFYFTRALESEFRGTGIRTCILLPSAVYTNERTNSRIERGGWFARKSALTAEQTASEAVKALFRGKRVWVPGRLTRLLFSMSVFLPEGIVMMTTRNVFRNYKPNF